MNVQAPETAAAPGQGAEVPGVYVRWCQLDGFDPPPEDIAAMFAGKTSAERYFWESLDEAARIARAAAQERPAAELAAALPPDPSADELRLAAEADEARGQLGTAWRLLDEARARLAVTAAERDGLAQALDERNAQHKQLLDGFDLVEGLDGDQHGVAVLEAAALARAYFDAGYPVRDDLSHLEA